MEITALGLDLAKNVFQLHEVDAQGHATLRKAVRCQHLLTTFAKMPPCLIGMEACASAHHWARKLQELGHAVRLMTLQFVKPYVKTNKNDAADAKDMRFTLASQLRQWGTTASRECRTRPHRSEAGQ